MKCFRGDILQFLVQLSKFLSKLEKVFFSRLLPVDKRSKLNQHTMFTVSGTCDVCPLRKMKLNIWIYILKMKNSNQCFQSLNLNELCFI